MTGLAVAAAATLALAVLWPGFALDVMVAAMATGFLISVVLRTGLVLAGRKPPAAPAPANDLPLPVYSILVPLYREAAMLPQLSQALAALDYPADRLDILLVLEEDDLPTRRAAERYAYPVVLVPAAAPRTKPKACNFAAHFAKGEFLVVYDAEDRPQPDQLRKAVDAFRAQPAVCCFQARLVVDRAQNWLQHLFALDYGIWFQALLPGLSRLRAPIPLGGTSNHFRRTALIDAGLWDPYNVTEDADLGLRLARLGGTVRVLDSATYEEAPAVFSIWLRQRTRWMKGYMQTLLVHWREPSLLVRQIGLGGALAMQLFLGGAVWSALVNPLLWLFFLASSVARPVAPDLLSGFAGASGGTLLVVNAILAALGALRGCDSKVRTPFWMLLSYPLFWFLISLACYRALYQLIRDPFRWEKTPHSAAV